MVHFSNGGPGVLSRKTLHHFKSRYKDSSSSLWLHGRSEYTSCPKRCESYLKMLEYLEQQQQKW